MKKIADIKYDEAAYSIDNKNYTLVPIEKLIHLYTSQPLYFKRTYSGNLFCPLCRKPQLTIACLSKSQKYYLRGYPNQSHSPDCLKLIPSIDTSFLNDNLNDHKSIGYIKSQLLRLLINKFSDDKKIYVPLLKATGKKICFEEPKEEIVKNRSIKQIPTKSLTAPFYEDDYEQYKLFYGNVNIRVAEQKSKKHNNDNDCNYYILYIYNKDNLKLICSVSMSNKVGKNLISSYNLNKNVLTKNIFISLWSKFSINTVNNTTYKNGRITHSDFCVIQSHFK